MVTSKSTKIVKNTEKIDVNDYVQLQKELAAAQKKLALMPQLDSLTGFPNKALFDDRLQQGMARARRSQRMLAVVYLDINHTKLILAKLGASGKNKLTCAFAERFKSAIRETDTIARIGFDRFAVVMEEVKSTKMVKQILAKIVAEVDEGFIIENSEVVVTTSIGVAFFDGADTTMSELTASAEHALFKAKAAGISSYEFAGVEI